MMAFLVEIQYREPSYERRHGARPNPYRWRYRIYARSGEMAVEMALQEFREIAQLSSSGWSREVVAVEVLLVLPKGTAPADAYN